LIFPFSCFHVDPSGSDFPSKDLDLPSMDGDTPQQHWMAPALGGDLPSGPEHLNNLHFEVLQASAHINRSATVCERILPTLLGQVIIRCLEAAFWIQPAFLGAPRDIQPQLGSTGQGLLCLADCVEHHQVSYDYPPPSKVHFDSIGSAADLKVSWPTIIN
jgi:hypothetical protein